MKSYRRFIFFFIAVLLLYIIGEIYRPKPLDWTETLSKEDKKPFGAFVLFRQLHDIFPEAQINSFRLPLYDQVNNSTEKNTAYLLIDPTLDLSKADIDELLNYAVSGNYVFIAASKLNRELSDSLGFQVDRKFDYAGDSTIIHFTNHSLEPTKQYGSKRLTIDGFLKPKDTAAAHLVIGANQEDQMNFVRINYGAGAIFLHASPLCFSNYFLLHKNNAEYAAKALSCLPANISKIYWDEYYKLGPSGPNSPLRFILSNGYLRWAFWICMAGIISYVLFESKRRQRIIPVIQNPGNSTLDFVKTVGHVYYNQRDNRNIAMKKINYFLEFIRSEFYVPTSPLNDEFMESLAKKSGRSKEEVNVLVNTINNVYNNVETSDVLLLELNREIDLFYSNMK